MKQKEFRQIDLTGKVYAEFSLNEIQGEELREKLQKAERGDCIKFTGQTYLMKIADQLTETINPSKKEQEDDS